MVNTAMKKESRRYWPDNTTYFLTGSTFLHFPYFNNTAKKQILLNQIIKVKERINISDLIFSIAINHYHLKFHLCHGLDLAGVKQLVHGGTSYEYKRGFGMKYKEMWQSSKVLQVQSEEMDWKITGYIIGNLLKHKEESTFQELKGNPFSSYMEIVSMFGERFARGLVYDVININESSQGVVDFQELSGLKSIIPSAKAG